jgi:hypothetical protein
VSREIGRPYEFVKAPRLFLLLRRDGLANQKIPGPRYGTPPQEMIALDTEVLRRILVTIDVEKYPSGAGYRSRGLRSG